MSTLRLIEKDFSTFFRAPFSIDPSSLSVSPLKSDLKRFLDPKQNPLFRNQNDMTFFTAMRGQKPVGRIVCHIHRASNERHQTKQCYFGFFESENNMATANILLDAAETFARRHGLTEIIGNMNMTAMQQVGIMTSGFENKPYSDQVYSAPYLPELLEKNGFERFFPMTTFEISLDSYREESLLTEKSRQSIQSEDIVIRSISKSAIQKGLQDARLVLNSGFDKNPFFVPVTKEEFDFQAKDLSWVIDPQITSFAYKGDVAVGVLICIPDLNPLLIATESRIKASTPWHYLKFKMNRKRAVIIYYSLREEFQGRGINAHLLDHTLCALKKGGYESVGATWIADVNKASLRQMEKLKARPLHQLHLFRKRLA